MTLRPVDVYEGINAVMYRQAERPTRLRLHPGSYGDVLRWETYAAPATFEDWLRGPGVTNTLPVLGLRADVGDHYPKGVWRLLSTEGDLMYDPRQGRTLRDCLRGAFPGGPASDPPP